MKISQERTHFVDNLKILFKISKNNLFKKKTYKNNDVFVLKKISEIFFEKIILKTEPKKHN